MSLESRATKNSQSGWQSANDCLRAYSLYHTWKEGTVCSIHGSIVDYWICGEVSNRCIMKRYRTEDGKKQKAGGLSHSNRMMVEHKT